MNETATTALNPASTAPVADPLRTRTPPASKTSRGGPNRPTIKPIITTGKVPRAHEASGVSFRSMPMLWEGDQA